MYQLSIEKGDGIHTLQTSFNEYYYGEHIDISAHQVNASCNKYFEIKIREGKMTRKKQLGMTIFFTPKKKQVTSNDNSNGNDGDLWDNVNTDIIIVDEEYRTGKFSTNFLQSYH